MSDFASLQSFETVIALAAVASAFLEGGTVPSYEDVLGRLFGNVKE